MAKKYTWLKLKDDFFNTKEIKKLRKIAGGDTYTIIYLKLQLLSIRNEGKIFYEGIEENFYEELSLELDEETDNIKITMLFLEKHGLVEFLSDDECILPKVLENFGSETASASRVRKHRALKAQDDKKALHCNGSVTDCNIDKEKEKRREEKDIEKDIDKNIYADAFTYYLSKKNLIKHKELTEPMKKSIDKAVNTYKLDFEYIKRIIDRHSEKVEATKDKGEYKAKVRTLAELFGQKKYQSQDFICVDYLDEVYQEVKQINQEKSTGYKETVYDTSFNDVLEEE